MSTVIVVLWSAASVVSPWVRDEAAFARDKKHLIPLRIDGTEPPLGFRQLHTLELGRWNGDGEAPAFVSLSDSVRHALGSPVSPRAQLVPTKPKAKRHRIVAIGAALIIAALLASLTLVYTNRQGTDVLVGRVAIQPFVTLARAEADAFGVQFGTIVADGCVVRSTIGTTSRTSSHRSFCVC
jgi:hypothetical protein